MDVLSLELPKVLVEVQPATIEVMVPVVLAPTTVEVWGELAISILQTLALLILLL
jgi:hypothetical protein